MTEIRKRPPLCDGCRRREATVTLQADQPPTLCRPCVREALGELKEGAG